MAVIISHRCTWKLERNTCLENTEGSGYLQRCIVLQYRLPACVVNITLHNLNGTTAFNLIDVFEQMVIQYYSSFIF
jgi:hypothetical protein